MRIGVAGLNPHAGEGGLFGREEIEIISPAIAAAQAEGIDVVGPFAPDTIFMRARDKVVNGIKQLGEFDAVVAMYHDQGLDSGEVPGGGAGRECDAGACRWFAPALTMARRLTLRGRALRMLQLDCGDQNGEKLGRLGLKTVKAVIMPKNVI